MAMSNRGGPVRGRAMLAAWAGSLGACLFLVAAAAPADGPPPTVIEHPGGVILLVERPQELGLAPRIATAAEDAARELPLRTGLGLPPRVEVVICGDAETFARIAGRAQVNWLLGVARPDRGLAALNGPLLVPGPERGPAGVLRHELAHLALGRAGAGPLPRWFDEGVASWFAGGVTEVGPLDLVQFSASADLTLARLTHSFPEDPVALRSAYMKSNLVIEHLEKRHGPGTVAAICAAFARGIPFGVTLRAVTGLDVDELDAEFEHAQAPHGLFLGVLKRSISPFLLMALLAILAFLLRRRRLKRRLEAWALAEGEARETGIAASAPEKLPRGGGEEPES